jgi:hypothetical protein
MLAKFHGVHIFFFAKTIWAKVETRFRLQNNLATKFCLQNNLAAKFFLQNRGGVIPLLFILQNGVRTPQSTKWVRDR